VWRPGGSDNKYGNVELIIRGTDSGGRGTFELVRTLDVCDHVAWRSVLKVSSLRMLSRTACSHTWPRGRWQFIERNLVALGDLLKRAIQLFIGNVKPTCLAAESDLLQDQPLEHCCLSTPRGKLDFLF